MNTSLRSSDVSAQHLAITWAGDAWTVRDLASRNGTWLDGRKLAVGEVAALRKGAALQVGSPVERLTLVDDAPPCPQALAGEQVIEGSAELLALPSPEDPVAVVMFDPEEGWVLSMEDRRAAVRDGHELEVAGTRWRLSLPESLDRTAEARALPQGASDLGLRFKVSGDEEYVELTVTLSGRAHRLAPKSHHYLLLTLARARLEEADSPEPERGWVYTEDLMKMLRISSNQLYVAMHRARKEIEGLGLADGAELIERRATTHQVRLGSGDLRVEGL